MMPLIQTKIRCQLGCRLEYQGPRQTTSRVAGEKSTTGPTIVKEKQKYFRNSLNLLQWNAEGLGTNNNNNNNAWLLYSAFPSFSTCPKRFTIIITPTDQYLQSETISTSREAYKPGSHEGAQSLAF